MRRSLLVVLTAACTSDPSVASLGSQDEAALSQNALSQNALSQNALSQNALSQNALSQNALSQNGLNMVSKAYGSDACNSSMGRQFIQYLTKCALTPGQTNTTPLFCTDASGNKWGLNDTLYTGLNDGSNGASYQGVLGLAPDWANQGGACSSDADCGGVAGQCNTTTLTCNPVTLTDKRMVSACLLAHVNAFGVHIPISVRANLPETSLAASAYTVDPSEATAYPDYEASFYGNLFLDPNTDGTTMQRFACSGDGWLKYMNGAPYSDFLSWRVCGAPSPGCPTFVNPGPYCDGASSNLWYKSDNTAVLSKSDFESNCTSWGWIYYNGMMTRLCRSAAASWSSTVDGPMAWDAGEVVSITTSSKSSPPSGSAYYGNTTYPYTYLYISTDPNFASNVYYYSYDSNGNANATFTVPTTGSWYVKEWVYSPDTYYEYANFALSGYIPSGTYARTGFYPTGTPACRSQYTQNESGGYAASSTDHRGDQVTESNCDATVVGKGTFQQVITTYLRPGDEKTELQLCSKMQWKDPKTGESYLGCGACRADSDCQGGVAGSGGGYCRLFKNCHCDMNRPTAWTGSGLGVCTPG